MDRLAIRIVVSEAGSTQKLTLAKERETEDGEAAAGDEAPSGGGTPSADLDTDTDGFFFRDGSTEARSTMQSPTTKHMAATMGATMTPTMARNADSEALAVSLGPGTSRSGAGASAEAEGRSGSDGYTVAVAYGQPAGGG